MNIDALRSTASSARSNTPAKEGHVNHDVPDVPVEAHINPMTGSRSMLQEQEEATRARRYRFLKQNEREKLTYYLELKKIQ